MLISAVNQCFLHYNKAKHWSVDARVRVALKGLNTSWKTSGSGLLHGRSPSSPAGAGQWSCPDRGIHLALISSLGALKSISEQLEILCIDSKLTWTSHLSNICKRVGQWDSASEHYASQPTSLSLQAESTSTKLRPGVSWSTPALPGQMPHSLLSGSWILSRKRH